MAVKLRVYDYPKIADCDSPAVWQEVVNRDVWQRATQSWQAIHQPPLANYLDSEIDQKIRKEFPILLY